jgi:hypothetical protein
LPLSLLFLLSFSSLPAYCSSSNSKLC